MAKREAMYWQGHPVRDDEHRRKLNLRAADLEFGAGHQGQRLPRPMAEDQAKREDRQERHAQMAAHHLDGMKACHAVGNYDGAEQHYGMYGLHLKQLGKHPIGPVPAEVERWRNAEDRKWHYADFKGGADDHLLLESDGQVRKSEDEADKALALHAGFGGADVSPQTRQKLLGYLRGMGVTQPSLQVLPGGTAAPAPTDRSALRVVKAEHLPFLERLSVLAKAQRQPTSAREFAVHKTFLRHKHEPEERAFDYSAFLSPEQYNSGYRMFALSHGKGNPVRVHVMHHPLGAGPTWGVRAAGAVGNVEDGDLGVQTYFVHPSAQHQTAGLEPAMLNAMMHHGKTQMGAYSLSHGDFEPHASALIEAVAKPHGFQLGEVEDVDVPEPTFKMKAKEGRSRKPLMVDFGD